MQEYLITDLLTQRRTWTRGTTVVDAIIRHENALREAPDRTFPRPAQLLPSTARASHYSVGRSYDVHLGDSGCFGRATDVCRQVRVPADA